MVTIVVIAPVRPKSKMKGKGCMVAQQFSVPRTQPRENLFPLVDGLDCFALLLYYYDILLERAYATAELNAGDPNAAIAQWLVPFQGLTDSILTNVTDRLL